MSKIFKFTIKKLLFTIASFGSGMWSIYIVPKYANISNVRNKQKETQKNKQLLKLPTGNFHFPFNQQKQKSRFITVSSNYTHTYVLTYMHACIHMYLHTKRRILGCVIATLMIVNWSNTT